MYNWNKKINNWYIMKKKGAFFKLCKNVTMKNDAKVLQKTDGVFVTFLFSFYKKILGNNGKLEKHEHSLAHTVK